jgi:hypothetical protein
MSAPRADSSAVTSASVQGVSAARLPPLLLLLLLLLPSRLPLPSPPRAP